MSYPVQALLPVTQKDEYLKQPAVLALRDELVSLITADKPFHQHYGKWQCANLPEAKHNYDWHGDYTHNERRLNQLSSELKDALARGDERDAFIAAVKIMDWGQVHRGCIEYVITKYEAACLCSTLTRAIKTLDSEHYALESFNQLDLRMDSGLTKVYSLGAQQSVIYDSRVCAALLLVAYRGLSSEHIQQLDDWVVLAGKSVTLANQKRSHIKEQRVVSNKLTPCKEDNRRKVLLPIQAHLNLVTNWLLQSAVDEALAQKPDLYALWQVEPSDRTALLRAIEAALFMIGADISKG